MKNILTLMVSSLILIFVFANCNVEPEDPVLLYESEMNGGWIAFTQNRFDEAYFRFHQAIDVDSTKAEAFSGLGWVLFKQDSLSKAIEMFMAAELMITPDASLFAGHAFALNAIKNFPSSNQMADFALETDSLWYFPFITSLDFNDLIVLKAENFFMLGSFAQSLREVNKINPDFKPSLTTPTGIAALANEIEKLKRY
jgi:tetratricopeptide (TPR) repeat protein